MPKFDKPSDEGYNIIARYIPLKGKPQELSYPDTTSSG